MELPFRIDHVRRAGALPSRHHDPFERMLVALARAKEPTPITGGRCRCIEPYDLWVSWT